MRPLRFRPALRARADRTHGNSPTTLYFRKTGKPRLAQKLRRELPLHAGKVPNGVRLEKPAAPANRFRRLPEIVSEICLKTLSSLAQSARDFGCVLSLRLRPQPPQHWSWRRESNPRPSDYKSDALPTELRQQLGTNAPPRKLIPRIPSRYPGQLNKISQAGVTAQHSGEITLTASTLCPESQALAGA
jgi:hypothetical protein